VSNIKRMIDFVSLALYDKRINVEHIGQSTENKKLMRTLYQAARHITLTQWTDLRERRIIQCSSLGQKYIFSV